MRRIDWGKWAAFLIVLFLSVLFVWVLLRVVLVLFLPFLLALALAVSTRPLVCLLAQKTGRSKRFWAVSVTLLVLLLTGALSYLLCHRLLLEMQRLLHFLTEDSAREDGKIAQIVAFFREAWARLPLVSRLQRIELIETLIGDPMTYLVEQLQRLLSSLAERLVGGFAALLRRLPGVLLFLLVSVISCFYFALEYERVRAFLLRMLPKRVAARLPVWKKRVSEALKRCLRAYFLLFLLTFAQLSLGFALLRVEYPFLIALFGAALDILPVLGVGTLLLPWGLFALLSGATWRGVWLLALYAVMTVVRQIAEPHLVGKSLGLPPLLMLIAFYAGVNLFGFAGIFLGPALAVLGKAAFAYAGADQE